MVKSTEHRAEHGDVTFLSGTQFTPSPREHAQCMREAICLPKPQAIYKQEWTGSWTGLTCTWTKKTCFWFPIPGWALHMKESRYPTIPILRRGERRLREANHLT